MIRTISKATCTLFFIGMVGACTSDPTREPTAPADESIETYDLDQPAQPVTGPGEKADDDLMGGDQSQAKAADAATDTAASPEESKKDCEKACKKQGKKNCKKVCSKETSDSDDSAQPPQE